MINENEGGAMNHQLALEAAADRMKHAINYLTVEEKAGWVVAAYLAVRAGLDDPAPGLLALLADFE